MQFHWNILDDKRLVILPLFRDFTAQGFYLAGGTGLALQLGHRDSIDFDFFKEGDYDTAELVRNLESLFKDHKFLITQQEKNVVSCLIDESIQLSFFGYHYKILNPLIETEYFNIASIEDIACMKFSAITGRSMEKDYVDLYFILQKFPLKDLLSFCAEKYPSLDISLILKSLIYFDDIADEPILFKEGHDVTFDNIKKYLKEKIAQYFENVVKKKLN